MASGHVPRLVIPVALSANALAEEHVHPTASAGPDEAAALSIVTAGSPDLRSFAVPTAVALLSLGVYIRTLMPGVSFSDWAEIQTIPHVLGVAHPTGYPTYVLLAWAAELVPIGSIAYRANLLSAVLVALSLATFTVIAQRLGVRPLTAAATALALGAVGTVWASATVARVDPLHLLFSALLIHRTLVWADRRRPFDLVLGGLLVGLSLGNHLLTLTVAPFLLLFAVWVGRRQLLARWWLLPAALGAMVLGLTVYLYIPWAASRNPPLTYNHPVTLDAVLWLVTGTQFRGQFQFLSPRGPTGFVAALPALWGLASSRATLILPLGGMVGLGWLIRLRPAFGLACLGILLTGLYFWANYGRLEHYLLVPLLVLAIGMAVALEWVARFLTAGSEWIGRRARRSAGAAGGPADRSVDNTAEEDASDPVTTIAVRADRSIPGLAIGLAGLAFAVALAWANWSAADRSADVSGQTYVSAVFSSLPANAAIVSYWDASTPLWYGQQVEGLRPDVLVVDDTNIVYEGWGTAVARIASLICARPVFAIRNGSGDLATIAKRFRVTPFIAVRVGAYAPTATISRTVWQVQALGSPSC
jgi:hypothetical protein